MSVRSKVVRGLLAGSNLCGGPVLLDLVSKRSLQVLMYHGVPSRERFDGVENFYGYNVPLKEFEEQMRYLRRRCNLVSVSNLVRGESLSRTRLNVALTFDDGYENNCTNAFPVLEELGIPATFALATGFVSGEEALWNDVVEYGVQHCSKKSVEIEWNDAVHAFPLETLGQRLQLNGWLLRQCVEVEQERRGELIELALEALGVSGGPEDLFQHPDYRPMGPEEISRMAACDLVEFASHSVHHFLLAKLQPENLRAELIESKREVEKMTGRPCPLLCLPGGSKDSGVLDEAFRAGYEYVLTSDIGRADGSQVTRRVLNRNGVFRRDSLHRFADELHGPVLGTMAALRRPLRAVRSLLRS